MTNREQFYLAAFIIGILLLLAWWTSQPAESAQPERYKVYVVQPGDVLWKIAKKYQPDKDPREVVYEIEQLNGITPVIFPGQRIRIRVE